MSFQEPCPSLLFSLRTLNIWGRAVADKWDPKHSVEVRSPRWGAAGPTRGVLDKNTNTNTNAKIHGTGSLQKHSVPNRRESQEALVLEINYCSYRGRGAKDILVSKGERARGQKKAGKVRIYVIFAFLAFCSRGAEG